MKLKAAWFFLRCHGNIHRLQQGGYFSLYRTLIIVQMIDRHEEKNKSPCHEKVMFFVLGQ